MSAAAIALAAALVITSTPAEATGQATWIHESLAGGTMADGRVYRPTEFVCAGTEWELGTWLRVINVESGRSVVCRVSDRGRMPAGDVDLSPRAFREIGDLRQGRLRVLIQVEEEK